MSEKSVEIIKGKIVLTRFSRVDWWAEPLVYRVTMLIIIVMSFVVRAHGLWVSSIDRDEGLYLVIAQRWLHGELPYVGVWDQHPPGLPSLLALVQAVIPDPVLGARLAATSAVAVTALVIHRFCVRFMKRADIGVIAASLYIICISRWLGLSANTEVFNNAFVTCAAYLLYGAATQTGSGHIWKALIAAGLFGLSLQIKYVTLPEAILLCLGYLVVRFKRKRDLHAVIAMTGSLGLIGLLPTILAVLYFWMHGDLRAFVDANIKSNISYLGMMVPLPAILRSSASGIAPIVGSVLVVAYALHRGVSWRWKHVIVLSPQTWILLWSIAAAIDVCLPLKFWTHYYFALYPPISIAGAMALSVVAQTQIRPFMIGLTILFTTAVPLWIIGETLADQRTDPDAPRVVADYLHDAGAVGNNVFVYDYQPVVYALAGTRPPTPYVLGIELAQFSRSAHVNGSVEVQRIMDMRPEFVVLRTRIPDEEPPVDLDHIVARGLAGYNLMLRVTDAENYSTVSVYKR